MEADALHELKRKRVGMNRSGRKNAAGGWLRGKVLGDAASAGMLYMAVAGFGIGFIVRGFGAFDGSRETLAVWGVLGAMIVGLGALYLFRRHIEATWGRGLEAERQIGDLIEHAVAQRGCAFAHDVKGALGGRGNVDHIVMTPVGIWVVETKARWLSKRRFPSALRQAAENVHRVRRHLGTSLPVRGALVIADRSKDSLELDHDWNGEPVKVFGAKKFWRLLCKERERHRAIDKSSETAGTARMVWSLGSSRYSES